MIEKLKLGRYDYAAYTAFAAYAVCSLSIPLVIVAMGKELHFPLDKGGMAAGGALHLLRSAALVIALLSCGCLAGRIGKRRSMGFSMLLSAAGILTCAAAPAYALLLPGLAIAGLGEGICEGMATPFVQDLHKDAPERYVNIAHSFWSVGIGICVLMAGGLLTCGVSWRIVMLLAGTAAGTAALMFLWREHPEKRYPESGGAANWNEVFRFSVQIAKVPRFWVYCLGMFLGAGAEFCLTFWSAAYLQLHFRTGVWMAGVGTGSIALGMFIGRMGFGYFARESRLKHVLLICALANIPVTILLAVLKPEMFSSHGILYIILMVLLILGGIGIGPYWPTLQVYGVKQLPELDSTLLYIYFSAIGIPGCGFFTWLMGYLGDRFGLSGAFWMLPATLLAFSLTIGLEGWIWPRKPAVR